MFSWANKQLEKLSETLAPPPSLPAHRFLTALASNNEHAALAILNGNDGSGEPPLDPNGPLNQRGCNALHIAASHCSINIVRELILARGGGGVVSVESLDYNGWTPLHHAASSKCPPPTVLATVKLLVEECNANVLAKNVRHESPYDVASSQAVRGYLLPRQLQLETAAGVVGEGGERPLPTNVAPPPTIGMGSMMHNNNTMPPTMNSNAAHDPVAALMQPPNSDPVAALMLPPNNLSGSNHSHNHGHGNHSMPPPGGMPPSAISHSAPSTGIMFPPPPGNSSSATMPPPPAVGNMPPPPAAGMPNMPPPPAANMPTIAMPPTSNNNYMPPPPGSNAVKNTMGGGISMSMPPPPKLGSLMPPPPMMSLQPPAAVAHGAASMQPPPAVGNYETPRKALAGGNESAVTVNSAASPTSMQPSPAAVSGQSTPSAALGIVDNTNNNENDISGAMEDVSLDQPSPAAPTSAMGNFPPTPVAAITTTPQQQVFQSQQSPQMAQQHNQHLAGGAPMPGPPMPSPAGPGNGIGINSHSIAKSPHFAGANNNINNNIPTNPPPTSGGFPAPPTSSGSGYALRGGRANTASVLGSQSKYKPDGFHSSSNDKELQAKYGHVTNDFEAMRKSAVPPPPTSGGLPGGGGMAAPVSGGGEGMQHSGAVPGPPGPAGGAPNPYSGYHRPTSRYPSYCAVSNSVSAPSSLSGVGGNQTMPAVPVYATFNPGASNANHHNVNGAQHQQQPVSYAQQQPQQQQQYFPPPPGQGNY